MSGEQEPLSMKRNMLWNSAGSFTNLLAQWLITVLVVRIASGYDAAGLYSLAVSVYGIFAPVAQYRMYTYQISDTRHENTVGEYFTLRVITNGIALVACFGYALLTCPLSAVRLCFTVCSNLRHCSSMSSMLATSGTTGWTTSAYLWQCRA